MYTSPSQKVYIGQTIDEKARMFSHKCKAKKLEESYFSRAIMKYGFDNFKYDVLHRAYGETKEDIKVLLNFWERYYISEYKSNQKEYGYNLNIGGGSNVGYKHTEESKQKIRDRVSGENNYNFGKKASENTRLKMSAAHSGFRHTEEAKEKLSRIRSGINNPMYGKKLSAETLAKISGENNHRYGKHLSEETRKKISNSNRGRVLSEITRKHISESHARRGKNTYSTGAMHTSAIWILPDGTEREMKICHVKRFHKDWIMKDTNINNMSSWAKSQPHRDGESDE